jgi:hypothetical protein
MFVLTRQYHVGPYPLMEWQQSINSAIQGGCHLYAKLGKAESHIAHLHARDRALDNYI